MPLVLTDGNGTAAVVDVVRLPVDAGDGEIDVEG
jgi:hypothetical protein